MTKNILELGIYIAIMSLLLGIVALISVLFTDVNRSKSEDINSNLQYIHLQN